MSKQTSLPIFGDSIERPSPLPTGLEQVKKSLASGAPMDMALKSGGFTLDDYQAWRDSDEHQELIRELDKAEADFCVRCLKQVAIAADMGDVKSAQWLLERRFSSHFGRATAKTSTKITEEQIAIAEEIGGEVLNDLSEDEYRTLAVELLRRKISIEGESDD